MKKYGRFILGCVSFTAIALCVLTAQSASQGPSWLTYCHVALFFVSILTFAVVTTTW